jgi:hypothetical protein
MIDMHLSPPLFFAFSVVLHLMLVLLILPATLSTNHSKHVETSYIVLKLTFSVHNISWHLVLQFVISVANTKHKKQCTCNSKFLSLSNNLLSSFERFYVIYTSI